MKTFKDHLHLPVTMIDDTATMMATLQARYNMLLFVFVFCKSLSVE
jgi:hypothetical protein